MICGSETWRYRITTDDISSDAQWSITGTFLRSMNGELYNQNVSSVGKLIVIEGAWWNLGRSLLS
jgi:hypothetical protein